MASESDKFFDFLRTQVEEQSIVEDDLELAKLALLVPELCDALAKAQPLSDAGSSVLAKAMAVVDAIIAEQVEGEA